MTGLYDRALKALEAYDKTGELPPAFDRKDESHKALNEELQNLASEYQDDIDHAQNELDKIESFERAWDKISKG